MMESMYCYSGLFRNPKSGINSLGQHLLTFEDRLGWSVFQVFVVTPCSYIVFRKNTLKNKYCITHSRANEFNVHTIAIAGLPSS